MSDLTRYFQLTPDILVEYNYYYLDNVLEQEGNAGDYMIDLDEYDTYVINNTYCSTRTFFWDKYADKFVTPVNKSESKFVQCINENNSIWNGADMNIKRSEEPIFSTVNNNDPGDLLCDNFRLHFTSRNYLGNNDYDGFILTVHIYDKIKNKICLLSQYIRKDDDSNINDSPVIINQKLYTTYLDFTIPNVYALLNSDIDWVNESTNGSEDVLKNAISPNYDLMDNTPIVISIYGVKSTIEKNDYEYYNTERLNSIYIPIFDKSNTVSIEINEADDGDYFIIYPKVNDNRSSFSDYVYNLSDGRPETYIVFHELTLTEHYTKNNSRFDSITHREQFIINAKNDISDTGDIETNVDESELDRQIYFRPVLRNTGKIGWFTINVKTYIINTLDNTTTVVSGSLRYGENDGDDPKKYGKRMNRIYLGSIPSKVNVYNKKPDIDRDGVRITNASSNVKIENHQHSVIGFVECTNVGVSIEQIPTEQLQ